MSDYRDTLVRLATDTETAFFDCNFNDDIVLKPKAQVALHSVSMERADNSIFIDGTNDTITFQTNNVAGFVVHTATIPPGNFNKQNAIRKFNELSDSMNAQLRVNKPDGSSNGNECGMRIKVSVQDNKKVQYQFQQGGQTNIAPTSFQATNITFKNVALATTNANCQRSGATNGDTAMNSAYMFIETPICNGCGYFTFCPRLLTIDGGNQGTTNRGGFVVGLTTNYNKGKGGALVENDLDFGIRLQNLNKVLQVKVGQNAQFADNGFNIEYTGLAGAGVAPNTDMPTGQDKPLFKDVNSHVGIITEGDGFTTKVKLVKFQIIDPNQPGEYNIQTLLEADLPLRNDDGEDLFYYPVFSPLGNVAQTSCGAFNMSIDPYYQGGPHEGDLDVGLPRAFLRDKAIKVTMPVSVAQYFGFTSNVLNPTLTAIPRTNPIFNASLLFESQIISDNYIIELLNIPLTSYDSLKAGRKNILEVIPASETHIDNDTGLVQYQPNERVYIDVGNSLPLLLRNIRARIVNTDYSTIDLVGLASINVIIRNLVDK